MSIVLYDTVTIDTVPPNPQAVAGYVGGSWQTYWPLVRAFPNAYHLSIAVSSGESADCLDVEPGDASPGLAPGWVQRMERQGVWKPCIYANLSTMPAVQGALNSAGIARDRVRLWVAEWTYAPHIPAGYDACQWTDRAWGRNLDESLCWDSFFVKPPPPDPHHYEWFPTGPFKWEGKVYNERASVELFDQLNQHPWRNRVRLYGVRRDLLALRKRVWWVAHYDPLTLKARAKPSWDDNRGWRYQELLRRSRGLN